MFHKLLWWNLNFTPWRQTSCGSDAFVWAETSLQFPSSQCLAPRVWLLSLLFQFLAITPDTQFWNSLLIFRRYSITSRIFMEYFVAFSKGFFLRCPHLEYVLFFWGVCHRWEGAVEVCGVLSLIDIDMSEILKKSDEDLDNTNRRKMRLCWAIIKPSPHWR